MRSIVTVRAMRVAARAMSSTTSTESVCRIASLHDSAEVDREPYMAPGLVTPEKVRLGKLPTDVWWHTIVSPTGREKTGYPTQKPVGLVRRMVAASSAPGDWVLDFFAGSGTLGAAAGQLDRRFVCVDRNPEAIEVMRARLPGATVWD